MISTRQADLLERMGPSSITVELYLRIDGDLALKWLGFPDSNGYTEEGWERITYLKKIIKKILRSFPNNANLVKYTAVAVIFHKLIDELRKDKRISSVKPISFSPEDMSIKVEIK